MTVYYNDNSHECCAWLRELMNAGLIPDGEVDERPIQEVKPDELIGFAQCHFFAGIGGWAYALQLAHWPNDREVWTGSCPCQPFSCAGKRRATDDERHVWPFWFKLISERRPATVFGEQVASELGYRWLTGVFADLEECGYAVAGADLCAAGVGAPHVRQRLYWVGNAAGRQDHQRKPGKVAEAPGMRESGNNAPGTAGAVGRMVNSDGEREQKWYCAESKQTAFQSAQRMSSTWTSTNWGADYILCGDGKQRRIEPGICLLADGFPSRVGLLRGYGNAIVPQVAAAFVKALMEAEATR